VLGGGGVWCRGGGAAAPPPPTAGTDAAKIRDDARQMRARVVAQYPGDNLWDLKYAPGGLMDIEFAAQTLQLIHGPAHPQVLDTNTIAALRKLEAAAVLSPADATALIAAAELEQALTQILRIALEETLKSAEATAGLKDLLVRAGGAADFAGLERRLATLQADAHGVFARLLAGSGAIA
jgi:[glutamine synthetase] adenylyltransferase / [glutamine synthetase]-adenylyl-L-tyrosine phosphorylase